MSSLLRSRSWASYRGVMKMSTVWSVVGAVLAVVIAWWLVQIVFSLVWFIAKLAIVAVVAVVVYLLIKQLFSSRE